ncbi:MAG: UTP--glucose-1-phosphate uridylyltransferase [Lentisphaeria bacterium]|nr:UTP--glucose-1-phosphate uridylyltransferase [Lentisphaeria bacterium]
MKAVIPAAGFGTRFLPFTKSVPKELIPILDKPVIQYVVEEALAAGIDEILVIISDGKEAVCRHFESDPELESRLEITGKKDLLEMVRSIGKGARIHYVYQKELDGLGGAIRCAKDFCKGEPFAVLLGDNVTGGEKNGILPELMEIFQEKKSSVVAVEQVPREKVSSYGVIAGHSGDGRLYELSALVEKPSVEESPSDLVIASRYIFTPEIFEALDVTLPGKNNEIQLTDAMQILLQRQKMYAFRVQGKRYDVGSRLSFLKTTLEFALKEEDSCRVLREFFLAHKNIL